MNARYARQIILPELGADGQARLQVARILCIGAGGLGSPALLYLAASGIGTIGIVDDDRVEISNLQRQILFRNADQSLSKSAIAQREILALNPAIACHAYSERLNADNAEILFNDYDIIIDGTDNLESKYLINDAAIKFNKPVVYGSILGFQGQVSVFNAGPYAPCYRCLFPDSNAVVANCAEAGVIGALAGIIGSMQALEAIKLALGAEFCRTRGLEILSGKIFLYDAKNLHTRFMPIARDPNCAVCSQPRDAINLTATAGACAMNSIKTIEINDLPNYQDWLLVDVRERDEWDQGHMDNAVLLPLSELRAETADLSVLPQDKNLLLYCQRGRRSITAGEILQAQGYNVVSMNGGYCGV